MRHIFASFMLCTLVAACSASHTAAPKAPVSPEACVAVIGTSVANVPPRDVPVIVVLHPGDVACLVSDSAGGIRAVPQAPANSPHISVRMTAERGMTLLAVKNDTSQGVAYRALMQLPNGPQWNETSIVPVMPGLFGFESWPQAIGAIALFEMRLETSR